MDPHADYPLLTPQQVADWLQVPLSTLHYWRQRRLGPPWIKVGRLVRYRPSSVSEWIEKEGA
jgi:predicted DNA-binding transcriptional regulator AlpA